MKTAHITGANGFVGHYLAARLIGAGYTVVATGKGQQRLNIEHESFTYLSLDITDRKATVAALATHKADFVVHCAAMTKPDDCELNKTAAWEINVNGTENLLAAAQRQGLPHFVHVSTDFVFAGTAAQYTEEDEGSPVNYYGLTKWEAEKKVRHYNGAWAIVRPILVYGYPQAGRSNILTFVADALKEGKTIKLFTDQQRRPTYVEDLVWGIEQILMQQATGIFHFSGMDTLSPYDIGRRVASHLLLDESLVQPVAADESAQPAKRPPQTIFNLQKVIGAFGYKPTSFDEGLRRTFEHTHTFGIGSYINT